MQKYCLLKQSTKSKRLAVPSLSNHNDAKYIFAHLAFLVILGTETCSKYEIKNHMGQRVYFAVEENGCFDRNFCSPLRAFTIRITDNTGQEVITVNRPLRCNSCWFPCYLQEVSTLYLSIHSAKYT